MNVFEIITVSIAYIRYLFLYFREQETECPPHLVTSENLLKIMQAQQTLEDLSQRMKVPKKLTQFLRNIHL